MPELPEVETIRRQLSARLTGRAIVAAAVLDPRLVAPADPEAVAGRLRGRVVEAVGRRGKHLCLELDASESAVVHLRMTGRLHWRPAGVPIEELYLRAWLELDDGATLALGDARRFGTLTLVPRPANGYWRQRIGIDPLGRAFTARRLGELLAGRRRGIKATLLDQALVAGLGNMYVDEALHAAGIHPERAAGALAHGELRRLHRAIRERLRAAIAAGGASIDSYRDGLGQRGSMQELLRVHLHAGDPCRRCRSTIVKGRVAGRGTYWCPGCQPRW